MLRGCQISKSKNLERTLINFTGYAALALFFRGGPEDAPALFRNVATICHPRERCVCVLFQIQG